MRRVSVGVMGMLGGAFLGFCTALLAVWLLYGVLDVGGGDAKAGLGALFTLGPAAMIGVGGMTSWWMLKRDRAGKGVGLAIGLGVLGLVFSIWLGAMLGIA